MKTTTNKNHESNYEEIESINNYEPEYSDLLDNLSLKSDNSENEVLTIEYN